LVVCIKEFFFDYALISDDLTGAAFLTGAFLAGTDLTTVFCMAFLAALLDLAQRSFCAAAILALASALKTRLLGLAETVLGTGCVRLGRPADLFTAVPTNIALACSKREISESIS
jgi:hypothetical protein